MNNIDKIIQNNKELIINLILENYCIDSSTYNLIEKEDDCRYCSHIDECDFVKHDGYYDDFRDYRCLCNWLNSDSEEND